ncbi:hypothetical protein Sta7437_3956 [Stanieria cyanosphaera PCC 7437]|uniref:Uncharacterized protein n=1 Tax=Stanieria cyanosphaera (strain ATCC 29371 / PCC 7437) TaxID=111780 RepID=K9XY28_STAC7|nr:hypothetical protein [Stanieria cyanosphaera]AFZ37438.1 hypothetical protein Sta7437_3956 [Stanieria cyanosphaera PCC 7437]
MKSDSWIHIEKIQVSRQQNLPNRVCFQFNENLLREIQLWQETNRKFQFASEILTDFRSYVLLNHQNNFSVELNFCSFYQQDEEKTAVIQSTISLDGKIVQQIRHDYLQEFQLLQRIINAHYWVIEQMLNQLKLKSSSKRTGLASKSRKKQTSQFARHLAQESQLLSWGLSLGLTIIVVLMLIVASINLPVILIITVLFALLAQVVIKNFLLSNSSDLALQKLLSKRFLSSTKIKKIKFNYLNKLK